MRMPLRTIVLATTVPAVALALTLNLPTRLQVRSASLPSEIPSKVLTVENLFNTPGMDNSMSFLAMRAMGGYIFLHLNSRRALAAGSRYSIREWAPSTLRA